jgi:hypothetical protein
MFVNGILLTGGLAAAAVRLLRSQQILRRVNTRLFDEFDFRDIPDRSNVGADEAFLAVCSDR